MGCTGETLLQPQHWWVVPTPSHLPNTWITKASKPHCCRMGSLARGSPQRWTIGLEDWVWKKEVKLGSTHPSSITLVSEKNFIAHYFPAITTYTVLSFPFPGYNQFTTQTAGQEDFCIPIWLILHLLLLVVCILNTGFNCIDHFGVFLQKLIWLCVMSMKISLFLKSTHLHTLCVLKVLHFKPSVITWKKHGYHLAQISLLSFLFFLEKEPGKRD